MAPGLLATLALLGVHHLTAPNAVGQTTLPAVTGRVLNASSGAPIPRVLVQLGTGTAFTDHDGNFSLLDAPSGGGMVILTKPGYFTSPERTDAPGFPVTAAQLASPLEFRLYPEALLTGTVATQDGAPLSRMQVTARRLATENGVRAFETVASVQTDSRGNFRLAVPAGDYKVGTQFVATGAETGLTILPATAPSGGGTLHVSSGEQQQVELRPKAGIPHSVSLALRGLPEDRSPVFTLSASIGTAWRMGADAQPDSDAVVLHLPAGSYSLSVLSMDGRDTSYGEARLSVPDHDIAGIAVQLAPIAPIAVTISVDPRESSAAPPSAAQLGLQLIPEQQEQGSRRENTISLQTLAGRGPVLSPRPGRYRLLATPRSTWYIESATYGGADILGQTLTVSPAGGSPPLELVVNNAVGSLDGKVTTHGDVTANAWIALLPTFPSATPMVTLRAGSDGSFSLPSLQPGSYLAIALEHRTGADLLDPAVRNGLGVRSETVSIAAGTRSTLNLEVASNGSSAP